MTSESRLEHEALRPDAELAEFIDSSAGAGAAVSFVGIARSRSSDGQAVTRLFLDHCPGMTERSLAEIATETLERFNVSDLRVVHRCGFIKPGEAIVFTAIAASHRRAAFEAADYLMDRLKTEAVFWKREERGTGCIWIEPTNEDREDRARWSDSCRE